MTSIEELVTSFRLAMKIEEAEETEE